MSKAKFEKNHFLVIKEAIDPKVANFVYNYFLMKRHVSLYYASISLKNTFLSRS